MCAPWPLCQSLGPELALAPLRPCPRPPRQGLGGVPKDEVAARSLFEAAHAGGLAVAACGLGAMHWGGQGGLAADFSAARAAFDVGARDVADCEMKLGMLALYGLGAPANVSEARARLASAAARGAWRSEYVLAQANERRFGDVAEDVRAAVAAYQRLLREK
eukprot:317684-Chlamydomonas_euryale.AAC.1